MKKNLTLTTKVTGKPDPEVKWFKDEKEIKGTFKIVMKKIEEVCTLTISGVTMQMSGVYKCVATNKAGEAVHSATITVSEKMEPPVFTLKPAAKDIFEGVTAKFEAKAKGVPVPELTWYRGEEKVETVDRLTVTTKEAQGVVSTSLTIEKCVVEDICELRVVAKNPAGEAECKTKLNVKSRTHSILACFRSKQYMNLSVNLTHICFYLFCHDCRRNRLCVQYLAYCS